MRERIIATSIAAAFIGLSLAMALTKAPWTDELFYSTPALDLISRGSLGVPIMEPTGCVALPAGTVYTGINHHVYYNSVLHFVISAAFYKLFGFTILTIRIYSMLWGLAFLAAWYLILRKLTNRSGVALLGAGLLAVNQLVVNAAADGRPDMTCAALGTAGLAVFLWVRERHLTRAILASQTLVAMAIAVHQIALLYFVAVLLAIVYLDRRRLGLRHIILAALPYLCVVGLWSVYILGDSRTAIAQFKVMFGHRLSRSAGLHEWLWRELRERYLAAYLSSDGLSIAIAKMLPYGFYLLAIAGAIATPTIRRHSGYRLLLLMTLISFCVLSVMDGSKMPYYLIHTVPLMCVLFAVWIGNLWNTGGVSRKVACALAVSFVLINISWTAYAVRRNPFQHEFATAAQAAHRHAQATSLVTGPLQMGLSFGFYNNLIDDATLGYYTGRGADVIIVDEQGYGEAFRGYARSSPVVDRHVSSLLTNQYTLVYQNRLYKVYAKRPPEPAAM